MGITTQTAYGTQISTQKIFTLVFQTKKSLPDVIGKVNCAKYQIQQLNHKMKKKVFSVVVLVRYPEQFC